jgi:hypothetical protein
VKRNLIYHLTPVGNWYQNIRYLRPHLKQFDGIRIVAVAQGPGLLPLEAFEKEIGFFDIVLKVENDPELRETITLPLLLQQLRIKAEKGSITFYGHTKGVSYARHTAVDLWTQNSYRKNLEDPAKVESTLKKFPIAGCYKRYGRFSNLKHGDWHYSGTFFWFRNDDLFLRSWKKAIFPHRYGAEAFLGCLYTKHEAACLFADRCGNPYSLEYQKSLLEKEEKLKLCA